MSLAGAIRCVARRRRATQGVLLLVTVLLGAGLSRLRLETELLDWLPSEHPGVHGLDALSRRLPGAVYQELVWLELDPESSRRAGIERITDRKSLLRQRELVDHVRARVPEVRGVFGVLPFLELLDAELSAGADDAPFSTLPPEDLLALLDAVIPGLVGSLVDPAGTGTVVAFAVESPGGSTVPREAGSAIRDALNSYGRGTESPFRGEFLVPVGLASGLAEVDRVLGRTLLELTPVAVLFLLLVLRWALGGWQLLLTVLASLAVGATCSLGLMGWCGMRLNVITIVLVPLYLGCGINYAILVSLDMSHRCASGESLEDASEMVARGSARAVLLTTVTTVTGLLVLAFSDIPGLTALGLHAATGMAILGALAAVVMPGFAAGAVPSRAAAGGRGSARVVEALVGTLSRRRLAIGLQAMLVLAAALLVDRPLVLLDVIEGNYPRGKPERRALERIRERCGGAFPELIVCQGDLAHPDALRVLRDVARRVSESEVLQGRFVPMGLPDLLQAREMAGAGRLLRDLGLSPGLLLRETLSDPGRLSAWLDRASTKRQPATADAIRGAVARLYEDPRWRPLAEMLVDPTLETSAVLLLGGDAGRDTQSVRVVWQELERITAETSGGDAGVRLSFIGYRTMAYLFAEASWRWIRVTGVVSLVVVLALAAWYLRSLRATIAVGMVGGSSGLLWLALLQIAGIHLSVFLVFPLVFAISMGSDYALHFLCRLRAEPAEHRFAVAAAAGRAIAVAAATDAGVFLVYAFTDLVSASQVMLAVVLAVVAVFVSTAILVPSISLDSR